VLFVLYLQSTALYGSAALAAGVAERDVPLDLLTPRGVQEARDPVGEPNGDADGELTGRGAEPSEATGEAPAGVQPDRS
jgi:hypothetical protein